MLNAFNDTYSQLVAFYLAARLFMGSYYCILALVIPMVRGMMLTQSILTLIPAVLWIGSIYISMPLRLAVIWIAIFLDLIGPIFVFVSMRVAKNFGPRVGAWAERVFEFYPAMNIEHKVERTNAFVTLVFGYSVVSIIYQSAAPFGLNAFYGKAALGLIQAFCFNWIYFELDGDDIFNHAIRRNVPAGASSFLLLALKFVLMSEALLWTVAHLPFVMSFILGAAALSKLVLANDCQDTSLAALTEAYRVASEDEIPIGLRWFYCAGLGIALFCMGIAFPSTPLPQLLIPYVGLISISHIHKDYPKGMRIVKRKRMTNRFIVCVILFCLPLARGLNSLQLISVVTGLIVWVLLLELWGCSCPEESFFGEKSQCKYTARCKVSKKDLESAVKNGHVVKVSELAKRGEKAVYNIT